MLTHSRQRRRRIPALLLAFALPLIWACGGSDGTGPGGGGGNCSITLTGAQSTSLDCSQPLAAWTSADDLTDFGFTVTTGSPTVVVSISFPGRPSTRSYNNTDTGAAAALAVDAGGPGWQAGIAEASPNIGSYTLTISSLSTLSSASDGIVYQAHGTLTATLEPDATSGASGTVTLNASF